MMLALSVIVGLLCMTSVATVAFVAVLTVCVATDIVRMEKRLDDLEADGKHRRQWDVEEARR